MKKTKLLALILTLVLVIAVPLSVSAAELDGWVQNGDLTWSYYADGYMYRNALVLYNDQYYYMDENGIMADSEWIDYEWGGKFYATAGGVLAQGGIYEIEGKNYFFDSSAFLYSAPSFNEYDNELGEWYYCFTNEDGSLKRNEWVDYEGGWYYVGNDSKAYTGIQKVGDKYYAFDNAGRMYDQLGLCEVYNYEEQCWIYVYVQNGGSLLTNSWYEYTDGEYDWYNGWYYFGADGIAYHNGAYKIGADYYYFYEDAKMADNTSVYSEEYDSELETWFPIGAYRAKAGGVLYVNTWYEHPEWDDTWYYYGEGGKAPYGPATIGGKTYLFDKEGRLVENSSVEVIKRSGIKYYASDKNGYSYELKNNAWTKVGDYWYYVQDGVLCTNGFYTIGNARYFFHYDGSLLTDSIYRNGYWDEEFETWKYETYYAKADGALARNEWIEYGWEWYYFGDDYLAKADGIYTIGGKQYHFSEYGYATQNSIFTYEDVLYIANEDCVLTAVNGWFKHPHYNEWMYEEDGYYYYDGIYEIDGKKYHFDHNGCLSTNTFVNVEEGYYIAGPDGDFVTKTGWTKMNGDHFYVTEGGLLYEGFLTEGGKTYYMTPRMNYCTLVLEDGVLYAVAESGAITEVTANGIYDLNYTRCCIENGSLVKNAWKYIDGEWYYFDSYGYMCTGGVHIVEGKLYYFYHYGAMAKGWIREGTSWLWADANGVLFTGLDASGYLFDEQGYLRTNEVVNYEDSYYVTNADGIATRLNDGWNKVGGYWYYMSEGSVYNNGSFVIDEKIYYFDYYGRMIADMLWNNRWFDANGNVITGWIQKDGYWYYGTPNEVDLGNLFTHDIYTIGGKEYFFDWDGKLFTNGVTTIYGYPYSADENGVLTELKNLEGWSYADNGSGYGMVLYYKDGEPYTGWVGNYYIDGGIMAVDEFIEDNGKYYFIKEDGTYHKSGWYKRVYDDIYGGGGADWYCAKSDGSLYFDEWYKEGNTWYYFDEYYMVSGGYYYIDGEEHMFDEDGKWLGKVTDIGNDTSKADGWHQENGKWCFYMAGEKRYNELLYSNGAWYYVDYNGYMVTNKFAASNDYYYDAPYYYYGADGKRVNYTGWKYIDNNWVYFASDSSVNYGWINDGKADYYIIRHYSNDDSDTWTFGLATGYRIIYGDLYSFASDGSLKGKVTKDGWYETKYGWVYIKDGKLLRETTDCKIGGTYYAFDYEGYMVEGAVYENKYYGTDGKLVTNPGWNYVTVFGKKGWIYVRQDGIVARGVQNIAGKEYFFDGALVISNGKPAVVNGWKLESGNWVYYRNSVKLTNCWQLDSVGWCYLKADGTMAKNQWIKDSVGWCYVGSNGYCVTNSWMKDSIGWCYLDSEGRMVTNGWVTDSKGKCWLDANGYWDGIYH